MKRTWQIWLLYGACLAVALAALAWLSLAALRLERDEQASRQQAKRDERIRLASWRIDTMLMPIIAPEATRPFSDYIRGSASTDRSAYVLGHFQLASEDRPPVSSEHVDPFAEPEDKIRRLAQLRDRVKYADLVARLPEEMLAASDQTNAAAVESSVNKQAAADQLARVDDDFLRRQQSNVKNIARELVQQHAALAAPQSVEVRQGVGRPLWVGDDLVLARRVIAGAEPLVQVCWLDWEKLRRDIRAEVADLLPDVELRPVRNEGEVNYAHALATLPVELAVPAVAAGAPGWTPLRVALVVAWTGLVAAAAAAALLLAGVVSLSRRREAFVSAVTHELRTPLTTFRMYSEMLESGMVTEDSRRKDYLRTLRVEADRLWHLVENVLAYAGLERGRRTGQRERLTLAELWTRLAGRLVDRAQQAGMEVAFEMNDDAAALAVVTDSAAVEQILFNLVDNACKYAAGAPRNVVHVQVTAGERDMRFRVRDHGAGIAPAEARRLFRPFSKSAVQAAGSAPGVGLGLALCRRLARQLGGDLRYEPADHHGATFVLSLPRA